MKIPLTLDRSSPLPVYRQIRDGIIRLVDDGTLRPGDRLPATRVLEGDLGAHRSTVVRAYEELRALGYAESRPGSYTTVRRWEREPGSLAPGAGPSVIDWGGITHDGVNALSEYGALEAFRSTATADVIDFDRLSADPALAPNAAIRRCIKRVLVHAGASAVDYADPAGLPPLRDVLARRMRVHGVTVSPGEVLPTAGAHHGVDLVLRTMTRVGDRVIVESPTYGMVHSLLRLHGLVPVEVPMRDTGMDLDVLTHTLHASGRHRPKLLYTMPSFHNPTGVTTEPEHRERLLLLCEEYRIPIVEDGFEEDLKYTGRGVLPLKSLDARGLVLYVGTLSKIVFPGLRLGWIAAPPGAISRLTDVLYASQLSSNTLAQAVAADFCASGDFEIHLRRAHRVYRRRMRALLRGLEQHMPAGVRWTRPRGGYTCWVTLPTHPISERDIVARLRTQGVKVGAGRRYYGCPPPEAHLRLSIACADDAQIEEGCRRIGRILTAILRAPPV